MSKILIIEDDKDINNMLEKLLQYHDYETMSAYSGTEGVLLHQEDIDLILLDLMLPGKSGEEIIKELKDPSNTHKYMMKTALKEINRQLQKEGIDLKINSYHFDLFNKVFGLKENERYCYIHKIYAQPSYSYSMQAIELIVGEIKKDSENILNNLKKMAKK